MILQFNNKRFRTHGNKNLSNTKNLLVKEIGENEDNICYIKTLSKNRIKIIERGI